MPFVFFARDYALPDRRRIAHSAPASSTTASSSSIRQSPGFPASSPTPPARRSTSRATKKDRYCGICPTAPKRYIMMRKAAGVPGEPRVRNASLLPQPWILYPRNGDVL